MKKVTKKEMIETIINNAVNSNWKGSRADDERIQWEKELKKKTHSELKKDFDIINERDFDYNIGGLK